MAANCAILRHTLVLYLLKRRLHFMIAWCLVLGSIRPLLVSVNLKQPSCFVKNGTALRWRTFHVKCNIALMASVLFSQLLPYCLIDPAGDLALRIKDC